jgi:hypothetical protein
MGELAARQNEPDMREPAVAGKIVFHCLNCPRVSETRAWTTFHARCQRQFGVTAVHSDLDSTRPFSVVHMWGSGLVAHLNRCIGAGRGARRSDRHTAQGIKQSPADAPTSITARGCGRLAQTGSQVVHRAVRSSACSEPASSLRPASCDREGVVGSLAPVRGAADKPHCREQEVRLLFGCRQVAQEFQRWPVTSDAESQFLVESAPPPGLLLSEDRISSGQPGIGSTFIAGAAIPRSAAVMRPFDPASLAATA